MENMYRAMMIFWLTCLVGYPRTSAPEPKIGDIIAITDGVDIVATAKVKSSPSYLRNYTLNLPPQISSFFDYHENENDTVAVKVDLVRTNIKIPYRQGAFCEILDSALQSQLP